MNGSVRLGVAMVAAIAIVATAMFYDEQREFELSLDVLSAEQAAIATAIAADFEARLKADADLGGVPADASAAQALVAQLIGGAAGLQQPRSRLVLVDDPRTPTFVTASGDRVHNAALRRAVSSGASELTLSRDDAADIGLPRRVAVASIRRIASTPAAWSVLVVASAERLRARERRAELRFLLGLGAVTLLVGAFGGLALRDQRRKAAVAKQLELSAFQRERERLLAKADKMTTLATLSSGIAHQVATPLNIIVARIEQILPLATDQPKIAAALGVVSEQVQRIQDVIRAVLSLSKGSGGTLVDAKAADLAVHALNAVRHRFEQAKVDVELELPSRAPPLRCDHALIEQALINLLLNACEASRPGQRVWLRVSHEASRVRFAVDDEGEGIGHAFLVRNHEPFRTTKPEGTGLGLAIAAEIVAHHGGALLLERREPRGTHAAIDLPVQELSSEREELRFSAS